MDRCREDDDYRPGVGISKDCKCCDLINVSYGWQIGPTMHLRDRNTYDPSRYPPQF